MKRFGGARRVLLVSGALVLACDGTPLTGDVGATSPAGIAATITGLHFTTSSAFPENPPPTNVDVTLTDPSPTRAIYVATLALPDFPAGRTNCPEDGGYSHTITFMKGPTVVATATLNAGGCRDVTISGSPSTRQSTDAYWMLVAENLGVEQSTFFSLASPSERLSNRAFVSESAEGFDLGTGGQLQLSFKDASVGGFDGCNSFSGTYEVRNNVLVITNMGSTGLGCFGARGDEEDWFTSLLAGGPTLAIDEPRLTLTAPAAKVTFIDRKIAIPDLPLVGTAWVGNGFSDGMVASFGPGSADVTLKLGSDGRVAIDTSCQAGTGAFTSDASTITFAGLTYDGAACADATFQATSDAALRVLDGAPVTYIIKEHALTVTHGSDSLLFHAAP